MEKNNSYVTILGSSQFIDSLAIPAQHKRVFNGEMDIWHVVDFGMSKGAAGWHFVACDLLCSVAERFKSTYGSESLILTVGAGDIEQELRVYETIRPGSVFIHHRLVDSGADSLLHDVVSYFAECNSIFFHTRSPLRLKERSLACIKSGHIAVPLNMMGAGLNLLDGTIGEHLEALECIRSDHNVYSLAPLAGGRLPLKEAIQFASCYSDGIFFGASTTQECKKSLEEISKKQLAMSGPLQECDVSDKSQIPALIGRAWRLAGKHAYSEVRPASGLLPSLKVLLLELTWECNYSCYHCYVDQRGISLDFEKAKSALVDFVEMGGEVVKLTGGEPTLYSRWKELVLFARNIGLQVIVCTNGSTLSEEEISFLQTHETGVQLSVDTLDRDLIKLIRNGHESFARTVNALQLLQKHMGNRWSCMITIMRPTLHQLEQVISEILPYLPGRIGFSLFKSAGFAKRVGAELSLSNPELFDVEQRIRKLADRFPGVIHSPFSVLERDRLLDTKIPRCLSVCGQWKIDPMGKIYPCPLLSADIAAVGSLADGIANGLNPEKMHSLYKMIWNRSTRISECLTCFWRLLCQAGCPARSEAVFGSFDRPDDLCALRQHNFLEKGVYKYDEKGC